MALISLISIKDYVMVMDHGVFSHACKCLRFFDITFQAVHTCSQESAGSAVRGGTEEGLPVSIQLDPRSEQVSSLDNGILVETEDKDVLIEGIAGVPDQNKWVSPQVFGRRPSPRYQVTAS